MKTLENEMNYLKKTVIKIKTLLTTKQLDSDHPTQASLISSRQEPLQGTRRQSHTRHPWINGEGSKIVQRTRSRRSSKSVDPYKCLYLNWRCHTPQPIFLPQPIFSPQPIFLSRQLTKEEADLQNLALVRRRQLIIDESADRKDLRVRDTTLYIRKSGNWIKEKLPKSEGPNWLAATINIFVYNVRSILEYQRRKTFSNANQVKNPYQLIWLNENIWLTLGRKHR